MGTKNPAYTTNRHLKMYRWLVEGKTTKEIAKLIDRGPWQVYRIISSPMFKAGFEKFVDKYQDSVISAKVSEFAGDPYRHHARVHLAPKAMEVYENAMNSEDSKTALAGADRGIDLARHGMQPVRGTGVQINNLAQAGAPVTINIPKETHDAILSAAKATERAREKYAGSETSD